MPRRRGGLGGSGGGRAGRGRRCDELSKRRCLIVGGQPQLRRALANLLHHEGYEAREVASAGEASRLLPDFVPDAILCDAGLGDSLVKVLRAARERNPAVRTVIARDGSSEASDALELADRVFDRPVNLFELRRALDR